ncbi:MAG TPA: sigma-70 family RNA polymerase sigma factor [Thiothrix sp.]|nr:sigma-70 family RNA polymerase sigma factor [Thiothrix sp.]
MRIYHELYQDLFVRCAKRDKHAFQQLYHHCSPMLYSIVLHIVKQKELAEDILQEAFLKIWHSAKLFRPEKDKAITWIITLTRNKTLDKLRSLKSQPQEIETAYEGIDFSTSSLQPYDNTQLNEEISSLMRCLGNLKTKQRECIVLAYYYGYTHTELAIKLDQLLRMVKTWLNRGQTKIQQALQQ